MPASAVVAFAPGRVNLIGEHTDYNDGLSMPFAIAEGVTVQAAAHGGELTVVHSEEQRERDSFRVAHPERCGGWRAFARGVVAELGRAGHRVPAAEIEITSDLAAGAGLSSSAALEVSLALGLLALAGVERPDPVELARICARVEHEWLGSRTGLLDQLASLLGERGTAILIDFRTLGFERIPLELGEWTLATFSTHTNRTLAASAYNERREECLRAAELLGAQSLRDAAVEDIEGLPEPLRRRARHVLSENERVLAAAAALRCADPGALAELLDRSHQSLRDDYEVSTPAVEQTIDRIRAAGARGARLIGGGFGGTVLALFAPGTSLPTDAVVRRAAPGARVVSREP